MIDDETDEGEETEEVIHRLMMAPTRWGPDDANLLWNEILPDGDVKSHVWIPDGDADRARLEAFWQACQQVDWDDLRVHEVAATGIRPPAFTMPTPAAPPVAREGPPPEFTDAGLVRRVPHDPAPVAESWRRIEAWMAIHCPEVVAALLPGASDKDIKKFEKATGRKLPEDVKASYRIHDGLGFVPDEYEERIKGDDDDADLPAFIHSVFYNYGLDSIRERRRCEAILPNWKHWAFFADSEEGEQHIDDCEVLPADAIQLRYACRGWIPLYNSHSNCFGVDLAPGPKGVVGQVINFGRDAHERKYVLATSWAQFLEDYADELDAGNIVVKGEPGDSERYLYIKRPEEESPIHWNWRAWAEAKLDPDFQGVGTAPPPEPVPADPETDRECRAVVEGFLADYRAWELRWLALRPVGELGFRSIIERPDGEISGNFHSRDEYKKGVPVPEAVAFIEAIKDKGYDAIWGDPWLKAHLKVGPHHAPAMADRGAIFAKYTTAWARRSQGDAFILNEKPRFDPETFREVLVYRADDETAYVWSTHVGSSWRGESNERFLLKREEGAWRIERLQVSIKGKPYRSKTLV